MFPCLIFPNPFIFKIIQRLIPRYTHQLHRDLTLDSIADHDVETTDLGNQPKDITTVGLLKVQRYPTPHKLCFANNNVVFRECPFRLGICLPVTLHLNGANLEPYRKSLYGRDGSLTLCEL